MNEANPKKRLVGWTQYLTHGLTKGATYSVAVVCGFGGLLVLAIALILAVGAAGAFAQRAPQPGVIYLAVSGFLAVIGLSTLVLCNIFFEKARQSAPVILLTKSSAKQLPEVETLVRSSDQPVSAEQTELLRAVRHRSETPEDQLLRASRANRLDV